MRPVAVRIGVIEVIGPDGRPRALCYVLAADGRLLSLVVLNGS